jgi:phosphomannomutase
VCVISGGTFKQFEKQLLRRLDAPPHALASLHVMPTTGTRYFRFDPKAEEWRQQYAEELNTDERKRIAAALEAGAGALGYRPAKLWGPQIEDRGTQVTFSALGQNAPVDVKRAWDPDGSKKARLRDHVAAALPEFGVRAGGTTSIDVTKGEVDKSYGIAKLIELLGLTKADVLFVGDRLDEGGNDYPVKAMGVDTVGVSGSQDTALVIETILEVV